MTYDANSRAGFHAATSSSAESQKDVMASGVEHAWATIWRSRSRHHAASLIGSRSLASTSANTRRWSCAGSADGGSVLATSPSSLQAIARSPGEDAGVASTGSGVDRELSGSLPSGEKREPFASAGSAARGIKGVFRWGLRGSIAAPMRPFTYQNAPFSVPKCALFTRLKGRTHAPISGSARLISRRQKGAGVLP